MIETAHFNEMLCFCQTALHHIQEDFVLTDCWSFEIFRSLLKGVYMEQYV